MKVTNLNLKFIINEFINKNSLTFAKVQFKIEWIKQEDELFASYKLLVTSH